MNNPTSFILIDDEPISNQLTEMQLKRIFAGAAVTSYCDPKEAILEIERNYLQYPINTVVFLDINMPYSGWRVMEAFEGYKREVYQRFVIYMLTSSTDVRDYEKAKQYPLVRACIQKMVSKEYLLDIFKDWKASPLRAVAGDK